MSARCYNHSQHLGSAHLSLLVSPEKYLHFLCGVSEKIPAVEGKDVLNASQHLIDGKLASLAGKSL